MPLVLANTTLTVGSAIIAESTLSFLGLGVQPPTAEWGSMLGQGKNYIFSASYMTTFPGVAIFIAVLAFNLIGDGLQDIFDPHRQT